ncbi:hypothetical protein HZA97_10070 [Candidatus Woesearchaeota archaeon]|nr:hypothetical protein [Candidatus Woesearchaeota archaeon]
MLNQDLQAVISKIKEQSGLPEKEVLQKIEEKLNQLSGLISKEGAANIVANELGVKLFENSGKIKDISTGLRSVEVLGKVTALYNITEFPRQDGTNGKVGSFMIGDETGTMRIVCWGTQADVIKQLSEGSIVKIKGGYVKENNRGFLEVHMNERAKIVVDPKGEKVETVSKTTIPAVAERKKLNEITENDAKVEVFGTVRQVFDPVFFEVCPKCGKRTKATEAGYNCQEHGSITPEYRYVMNVYLDDGHGTIRVVLFHEQAQKLLKKTNPEILEYRTNPMNFETIKNDLLGEQYKFTGKVKKNEVMNRIELVAYDLKPGNPEEELAKLQSS